MVYPHVLTLRMLPGDGVLVLQLWAKPLLQFTDELLGEAHVPRASGEPGGARKGWTWMCVESPWGTPENHLPSGNLT